MSDATTARERLRALVLERGHALPLDRAALLIAAEEYADLDLDAYLCWLDDLAAGARGAVRA